MILALNNDNVCNTQTIFKRTNHLMLDIKEQISKAASSVTYS